MNQSPLMSQEWCEVVFEHRNQAYGAYQLRREAGHRYWRVAKVFLWCFFLLLLMAAIAGYFVYKAVERTVQQLEEVAQLQPLKSERENFVVKQVSVGRRAVHTPNAVKGAVNVVPEVVDVPATTAPIGIDGHDDATPDAESSLIDRDTRHNQDELDLPVEGPQLTATEEVEDMPHFPGGLTALIQFIDAKVGYSAAAQRREAQGDVEVSFVVQPDGSVSNVEVTKSLDPALDRAVLAAVQQLPRWETAHRKQRKKPVRITIPVHFELN